MDFNNFNFSNSAIIKPPTTEERNQHNDNTLIQQKLIMIDSRDRNVDLYPKNNEFIIELDEPINDVSELELVSANMPINSYNINEHNNRLYFFVNSVSDFSKTYDHADNDLYNTDGSIKKNKIFYIKMIPNNYPNSKSITDYLKFNNHYVYSLETNQRTGKLASFYIVHNNTSNKYNILIFTGTYNTTADDFISEYICTTIFTSQQVLGDNPKLNSIIFRGDRLLYNQKTMYNYLPNSAHELFGFDLNYGFISNEYDDGVLNGSLMNYNLHLYPQDFTNVNTLASFYDTTQNFYTNSSNLIIKNVNNIVANLDTDNIQVSDIYINISNTMATNKVNEYVLLHLPSLPTMANKIASNNIVQNAYTKLHLGTGSTRNVFFGRIKAFTNVYTLKPSVKLTKLHIKLTDYNGNLFDFNNFNFTLTFSIMYNKQPKFYNY